jgi:hypothetical protein
VARGLETRSPARIKVPKDRFDRAEAWEAAPPVSREANESLIALENPREKTGLVSTG